MRWNFDGITRRSKSNRYDKRWWSQPFLSLSFGPSLSVSLPPPLSLSWKRETNSTWQRCAPWFVAQSISVVVSLRRVWILAAFHSFLTLQGYYTRKSNGRRGHRRYILPWASTSIWRSIHLIHSVYIKCIRWKSSIVHAYVNVNEIKRDQVLGYNEF